jgi:hypothetical protein
LYFILSVTFLFLHVFFFYPSLHGSQCSSSLPLFLFFLFFFFSFSLSLPPSLPPSLSSFSPSFLQNIVFVTLTLLIYGIRSRKLMLCHVALPPTASFTHCCILNGRVFWRNTEMSILNVRIPDVD